MEPRYFARYCNHTNTYSVEDAGGEIVADEIVDHQAAIALAQLCCLGYIDLTDDGELVFTKEHNEPDFEDDQEDTSEEEEDLADDDGPVDDAEEEINLASGEIAASMPIDKTARS